MNSQQIASHNHLVCKRPCPVSFPGRDFLQNRPAPIDAGPLLLLHGNLERHAIEPAELKNAAANLLRQTGDVVGPGFDLPGIGIDSPYGNGGDARATVILGVEEEPP